MSQQPTEHRWSCDKGRHQWLDVTRADQTRTHEVCVLCGERREGRKRITVEELKREYVVK